MHHGRPPSRRDAGAIAVPRSTSWHRSCTRRARGRERRQRRRAGRGRKASEKVEKAMHERKRGTLRSGRSGKKVTSRKQAIAIGLSEARRAGGKVPKRASSSRRKSSSRRRRA